MYSLFPNGPLRVTVTWTRYGDLNLFVFPPPNGTFVSWETPYAGSFSSWGALDPESTTYGPESAYWNPNITLHPVVNGTYKVVSV